MKKMQYTKEEKELLEEYKKSWEDKGFKVRDYKVDCCHVTWNYEFYKIPFENAIYKTLEDGKKVVEEYLKNHSCEGKKISIGCILYDLYEMNYTTYKEFTYRVNNKNEIELVDTFELNECSMEIIKKYLNRRK